jgi:hypothetical protein
VKCPTCGRERPKTHDQRKKFHGLCKQIGDHVGLTLRQVKEAIKEDYFGVDVWVVNGKTYRGVTSSEEPGRAGYSDLIEFTLQWAAENCELVLDVEKA